MPKASKTGVHGLYRDAKGRWAIDLRWTDPATGEHKRHRERLPASITAAAAKQRTREILNAALAGEFDPDREEARTLGAAFKEYLTWCESNRPNAVSKRKAALERLQASLGEVRVDRVSPFDVERFKRDRKAGGAAPATINRDLEVLSHAFGQFTAWGWVPDAVAKAVRDVPHLKEPPGRVRYLSADEEGRLMGALGKGRVRRIVTAALHSGMRLGELVSLRRDAVDLDAGIITLTRTKSNKVRRIYINAPLAEVLREAMATAPRTGGGKRRRASAAKVQAQPDARPASEFVFTSREGGAYTADGVRAIFRRAVRKAGIDNFRFHDLRHTTATRLRQHGAGIDVVADVLGHATLAMARRYAHLGVDTMRAAMASLPAPIAPVPVSHPAEQPAATRASAAGA